MSEERKKPGVAFWASVVLVAVLIAYPLSFGPACWIASRTHTDVARLFAVAYWPMWCAIQREVPVVSDILGAYVVIGMRSGGRLKIPSVGLLDENGAEITEISVN